MCGERGVLGLWTPLIGVSPAVVDRLTPEELDRIVIHEAAHVLRRDDRADCVQRAIHALVGWHPGVWWLDRRLRAEREAACDDWVVALTDAPVPYAAALVKLADLSRPKTAPQLTPGALSRPRCRYASTGCSIGIGTRRRVHHVLASEQRPPWR